MHEPLLKTDWERYHEHAEIDVDAARELLSPYCDTPIDTVTLEKTGCANSNYHIQFKNGQSVILRIYLRDHSALPRETGIHQLVKNLLPVPDIYYVDDSCSTYPHPYAITEWMAGTLMRDVIIQNDDAAIADIMRDAGTYLGIMRALKLPYGGFFQDDMQIRPFSAEEEYEPYMMQLLQHPAVAKCLGKNLQNDIQQLISQCCYLLPEINEANLTHADYDPANILVIREKDSWKISAILDWEFSFAGSYLFDIGTMLRYSHKLPPVYESSFIRSIEDAGAPLPSDWKKQAKLLDLISLLQLLNDNPAEQRPYLNRDVVRLITHTVNNFTKI